MRNTEQMIEVGSQKHLTEMENELYQWMLEHRGTLVSRASLLRNIWELPSDSSSRSVDMCIHRLRDKLENASILTVYGKGYMMSMY